MSGSMKVIDLAKERAQRALQQCVQFYWCGRMERMSRSPTHAKARCELPRRRRHQA